MGLIETATPIQREYFTEINSELADKGFLVTTTDDLITWARTGSLMPMQFLLRRRNDDGLWPTL
jgi:NADH-quinone oxidoreductase subunit B